MYDFAQQLPYVRHSISIGKMKLHVVEDFRVGLTGSDIDSKLRLD
jgi:hypothetical protein